MIKTDGATIETRFSNPGFIRHCTGLALLVFVFVALTACHKAEEPLSHEEIIKADLAEILELQGLSCDEVVKFEVSDRLDYRVECRSGEQYRVRVSSEGHVQAEPQQE